MIISKTSTKLTKMANHLVIDSKVKQAEDQVMLERKQNMKQLKSIRGYLSTIKTGSKAHLYEKVMRQRTNSVGLL